MDKNMENEMETGVWAYFLVLGRDEENMGGYIGIT